MDIENIILTERLKLTVDQYNNGLDWEVKKILHKKVSNFKNLTQILTVKGEPGHVVVDAKYTIFNN